MTRHPYLKQWFQFCPHCKTKLEAGSTHYLLCPRCDFEYYLNPAPAVAVLIEKDSKLLFAKRATEPKKGYWDTPGGFVDPGETAEECVLREVKEETTLEIEIITLLGTRDDLYDLEPTINLIYLAQVKSGTPQAHDDVSQLQWFSPDAILKEKLAFTNTRLAVKLYQAHQESH